MSKITKTLAQEIAIKVIAPFNVQIEECDAQMSQLVYEDYLASIPKDVMILYKKYPKYVYTCYYITIRDFGFIYQYINFPKDKNNNLIYLPNNKDWKFTQELADKLHKVDYKKQDLVEKRNRTQVEIESTLLALGTYKKVEENLPELAKFLPVRQTQALMLNIAPVKATINCLLSEDKKCMEKI